MPVGSTSAFMAVIAAAFGLLDGLNAAERAAAALGVYTDTSALLHGATPLDFKMFEVLTADEETAGHRGRPARLPGAARVVPVPGRRLQDQEVTGAVRIAPIGFVRDEHRDVIAEIASELLRVEGTSIGIAIAVTDRGTEVSVRGDSRLLGSDQPRIVRVIDYLLEVAFPGASASSTSAGPRIGWRVGRACRTTARPRSCPGAACATTTTRLVLEHCSAVRASRSWRRCRSRSDGTHPEEVVGLL